MALKDKSSQSQLLALVIKNDWTVRQAEQYVKRLKSGPVDSEEMSQKRSVQAETNQTKALGERLKTEVKLQPLASGGRLTIRYKDQNELDRLVNLLDK